MNLFSNAERGVESFSFNKKELRRIDMLSDSAAGNAALRKHAALEKSQAITEAAVKAEKEFNIKERNEIFAKQGIVDVQTTNAINTICTEAKTEIFKDILFEVFFKALVMDNDFLTEHTNDLKNLTDTYIDQNGGFKVLENAIKSSDSLLLKKIKVICESIANEVTERKLCDSKDCTLDPLNAAFDMTKDEKDTFDYAKGDIDIDTISDLVKDKVLTIVRDEKERQEHSSELISSIEDDLKSDTSVTDEKSLNEAFNKIVLNKSPIEEDTLFNTLLRNSYSDLLENVSITSTDKQNQDEFKDFSKHYDVNTTEDDLLNDESEDIDDDESIENKEINMDLILSESASHPTIDMDMVLCEALTRYTLMETLYTLKLEDYTAENIRKLTEKILNPVTESASVKEDNSFIKIRSQFFKIFNNIKNMKNVEKAKADLTKMVNSSKESEKEHINKNIDVGVKELNNAKDKNPHMKKFYNETIAWLNTLKK